MRFPTGNPAFTRFAGILSVPLLLAAALAGCATSGVNKGDINVVSIEEEWQLGQQLERDLANELDLVTDSAVRDYVNAVGQRIVARTEMAELPWSFHVVRDDELNAFNTPGGHVYVNTGLILAADKVSELVGVMAHEIAHGVARHSTEQLTRAYGLNFVATLLLGEDPATYQSILAQILGTGAIARFSREAEEEADKLAVHYSYEAGYDPQGLVDFFSELLGESGSRAPSFFATHPLTEDRIRDAQKRVDALPAPGNLVRADADFRAVQNRLR